MLFSLIKIRSTILLLSLSMFLSACVTETRLIGESPKAGDAELRAENSAKRAFSYMELNQFETAETILKEGLKESPRHSVLNYTYAILKLRLGLPKDAEKYFEAAIKKDPKNSLAAHDYGFYLCGQGRVNDAIEQFELAISNPLFQRRSMSYLRAGECIFNKDKQAAEEYFLSAYQADRTLSVALFRLSELNFSLNNALKARAYFQRYSSVQGESAASLFLGYKIETLAGADKEANLFREKLLTKFPGSPEAIELRKDKKRPLIQ